MNCAEAKLDEREPPRKEPSLWEYQGLGSWLPHARLRGVYSEAIDLEFVPAGA